MTLNERVLAMQDDLLACLQEHLRIPSVDETAAEGAPYGIACRESLDHVLKVAAQLGFRTENVDGHIPEFEEVLPFAQATVRQLGLHRERIPREKEVDAL